VSEDKPRKRRGAGRVTLNTVARQAGVSAITVSRYFNQPEQVSPERRERIAEVVAELGYVPNLVAGGLASARGRIVAMVIPNISGPIFANTIQGFSDTLSRHGYQLLLASSYFSAEQEESAVRAFLGWSPAALVLTSRFHSAGTEKMIADADIPVVETWDYVPEREPLQIGFSHYEVGVTAARYLHGQGYRRIAFVQNSAEGVIAKAQHRAVLGNLQAGTLPGQQAAGGQVVVGEEDRVGRCGVAHQRLHCLLASLLVAHPRAKGVAKNCSTRPCRYFRWKATAAPQWPRWRRSSAYPWRVCCITFRARSRC
jgi:DNA-binding LacI/PurR family transcriptional regulator